MKKITNLAMILTLISISLMGCGNKTNQAEKNEQSPIQVQEQEENHKKEAVKQSPPTVKDNKEGVEPNYFISDSKAEINYYKNQITWKKNNVNLIIKRSSTKIASIQVSKSNGTGHYNISIPEVMKVNEAKLTSVSLSPSEQFLAINILIVNVGHQLIVVDLDNGRSKTINNLTKTSYEMIQTFNWSPTDNKLAFSYGDTSSSKLAIYDFNNQELQNLPDNSSFFNTLYIMWNKEGTNFDFISESPVDKFKLYRYETSTNNVKEISKIARDEFSKYSKFAPVYYRESMTKNRKP